jgi:hypothetical protein
LVSCRRVSGASLVSVPPLWPLFESSFGTKEGLGNRFDQLGELRNSIRHSRSVNDVVRKDREAALSWFEDALDAAEPGSAAVG